MTSTPLQLRHGTVAMQSQVRCQSSSRNIHSSTDPKQWHKTPPTSPTVHPDTACPLPEQLRSIMRLLTTSVVVCTARQPGSDSGGSSGPARAMTMSSFTSLTLRPSPLVTFNVATPSRTLDALAASGRFAVHVLAGDAEGAAVAAHFTKGNVGDGMRLLDGLEGVGWHEAEGDVPVLQGPGVLFALRCKVVKDAAEGGLVRVRDHVIVVGEVEEMIEGTGKEEFGLVYADRRYRQVGGVLEQD